MRVLFLTNSPFLYGSGRILTSWLTQGRRQGVEGLVALQRPGELAQWLVANRFPCRVSGMPWPDLRHPFRTVWPAWQLARWARRERVALVHCNEHDVYPFGALVARLAAKPIVCNVRCKFELGFGAWAFGKREPDALMWSTRRMQQECSAALGGTVHADRQHIVGEGVDLNEFGGRQENADELRQKWGVSGDRVVVGMASALRPGKRIEDFLELARRLCAEDSRVFCALAGGPVPSDQAYADHIIPRIKAAEKDLPFRWVGHVEPVECFLHATDVQVSTSEHESFGMSVCEAMACSRPVAAYRACSVEEVVGEAGLTVETGDLDGLTAAVARLVRDPELRRGLGSRARQRVAEQFNPAKSLLQLKQIYQSILSGRQRAA